MQPPNGYDSVVGEPGGDLNYDESIGALLAPGMRSVIE